MFTKTIFNEASGHEEKYKSIYFRFDGGLFMPIHDYIADAQGFKYVWGIEYKRQWGWGDLSAREQGIIKELQDICAQNGFSGLCDTYPTERLDYSRRFYVEESRKFYHPHEMGYAPAHAVIWVRAEKEDADKQYAALCDFIVSQTEIDKRFSIRWEEVINTCHVDSSGKIAKEKESSPYKLNNEQEERMEQKKKEYFSSTEQNQDPAWKSYSDGYYVAPSDFLNEVKTLEGRIKHILNKLNEMQDSYTSMLYTEYHRYCSELRRCQRAINEFHWEFEMFDLYSFCSFDFQNEFFEVHAGCLLNIKEQPRCYLGIKKCDIPFYHLMNLDRHWDGNEYPFVHPEKKEVEITDECREIMQELKEICMKNGFTCCVDNSYTGWDIGSNKNVVHKFDEFGEFAIWDWIPQSEVKQRLEDLLKLIISQSKIDERFKPRFSTQKHKEQLDLAWSKKLEMLVEKIKKNRQKSKNYSGWHTR